jgi:hypothetical protein
VFGCAIVLLGDGNSENIWTALTNEHIPLSPTLFEKGSQYQEALPSG